MEAVNTSVTLISFFQSARPRTSEDGHLHSPRHENLESLHWTEFTSIPVQNLPTYFTTTVAYKLTHAEGRPERE